MLVVIECQKLQPAALENVKGLVLATHIAHCIAVSATPVNKFVGVVLAAELTGEEVACLGSRGLVKVLGTGSLLTW